MEQLYYTSAFQSCKTMIGWIISILQRTSCIRVMVWIALTKLYLVVSSHTINSFRWGGKDEWHHMAIVLDSDAGRLRCYLNGIVGFDLGWSIFCLTHSFIWRFWSIPITLAVYFRRKCWCWSDGPGPKSCYRFWIHGTAFWLQVCQ